MAATIILKAIFRNNTALKCCIKQCIVLESPFVLYTLYFSVSFSIMTPQRKKIATKMATIIKI